MCRVFLSYGHDEYAPLAERLKTDLEACGLPSWFDAERLKPGGDWERYIEEGLEWTAAEPGEGRFVLLMTPHSVRRPDGYCLNELARAMSRELPVVPVMVATVEPPLSIARLQWLDMRESMDGSPAVYADGLERLRRAIVDLDLDFEGVQTRVARRLRPLSFDADVQPHLAEFTGRQWVVELLDTWLADPYAGRVFWITGGPGAGKTALSAWLTTQRPELVAVHFCQHGNAHKVDAREAVTSIAYQLTTQLPDYEQRINALALDTALEETDAETLFDDLIVQPLVGLAPQDGEPRVILVDALDEATSRGANPLTRMLARAAPRLPPWLRLLVTSRPNEPEVAVHLQEHEPRRLEDAPENADDLRGYIAELLGDHDVGTVETILERSEGSFLYARWVSVEARGGRLDIRDTDSLPTGLGGVYLHYFERQFPDLDGYASRQRPVLEAMGAAAQPLPLDEVVVMLRWSEYDSVEILESFGSLVAVREGALHAFHLSVLEWIGDRAKAGRYWASPEAGRRRLADYSWSQYEARPQAMPAYALHHAAAHLIAARRADDAARLLMDYRILRPRAEQQVDSIINDLRDAGAAAFDADTAQALELVQSVLELARGILMRDPAQLASQLQARLVSHDESLIRTLVDEAAAAAPLLRALTPAVRQAGDPLTRAFRGVSTDDDDAELFALEAVAIDAARDLVLATGESGVVHAWRLGSGRLERRLDLSDDGFACGEIDPVRGRWVLGGWDGRVCILDLDALDDRQFDAGAGQVVQLALAPDGSRLWTLHAGAVQRWDLESHECEQRVELDGNAEGAALSPNGRTLAVGVGQEVRVAPADRLDQLVTLAAFATDVEALGYSPDGERLAVGLGDGTIALVSINAPQSPRTLAGHPMFGYTTKITGLRFIGGGRRLVSAGWDSALRVWDTVTTGEVAACHIDSKVFGLAVDATERWALTGPKMGSPRLWDLTRVGDVPGVARHGAGVSQVVGLEERGLVVTGGYEVDGNSVRLWRMSDGEPVQRLPVEGRLLGLAAGEDGRLRVLDEAGMASWTLSGAGGESDGRASVDPPPDWIWSICMTPDVAIGISGSTFVAWRAPRWRGRNVGDVESTSRKAALSGDGRVCAVLPYSTDVLRTFSLESGREVPITLDPVYRTETAALALSPTGTSAALATYAGAITIADLEDQTTRLLRAASGDTISVLAISGDETRLVAGTAGGRLELWDLERGAQEALFCGGEAWAAAWVSHRADRIVAGDALGGVHFLVRDS